MSTPNVRDVLRVKGRLSFNPTNVASGSYPWGGTSLGVVSRVYAVPSKAVYLVRAEEYGGVPTEGVEAGESWILRTRLESWDYDALAKIFPSVAAGTTTQHAVVTGPSNVGGVLSDRSVKLLFTPDDEDRHLMVLFYKALPVADGEMPFKADERWGLAVDWHAIYDASSRLYQIGRRQDLSL